MKSSFCFWILQAAFIFLDATFTKRELTFRALFGQILIQRIQDIHRFLSVFLGLSNGIAPTGHKLAQRPQLVHFPPALGFKGVIRQIKRCLFRQIKTGLLWCLIMV